MWTSTVRRRRCRRLCEWIFHFIDAVLFIPLLSVIQTVRAAAFASREAQQSRTSVSWPSQKRTNSSSLSTSTRTTATWRLWWRPATSPRSSVLPRPGAGAPLSTLASTTESNLLAVVIHNFLGFLKASFIILLLEECRLQGVRKLAVNC